jgi:hypothetical protein
MSWSRRTIAAMTSASERKLDHRTGARRHCFDLLNNGAVEATLAWLQDADCRDRVGWYLMRPGRARAPRRLAVDRAIEDLAAELRRPDAVWLEDADSLAMLTADRALQHALRLVRGELPASPDRLESFRPGRYEVLVADAELVSLGSAFPALALSRWGGVVVLEGAFDAASMQAARDRLARLGARVVGVLPSDRSRQHGGSH